MKGKKGQVNTLAPAILALVFAAVVLVFGLVITQELRDVDVIKYSATVTNESGCYINATGYTLGAEEGAKTDSFAITSVYNNTDGIIILSGNYTVDSSTGVVTNATSTTWADVNITYTYQTGGEAWDSANDTIVGLGTFADFWELIVLAIVITIVIGLLLVVFGGRAKR